MRTFGLTPEEFQRVLAGPKRPSTALQILSFMSETSSSLTCAECANSLGLHLGLVSPRFSELERAGCLKVTSLRRRTERGGNARVCTVAENADFRKYLKLKKNMSLKISLADQKVLTVGQEFLRGWDKATGDEVKAALVKKLVRDLLATRVDSA